MHFISKTKAEISGYPITDSVADVSRRGILIYYTMSLGNNERQLMLYADQSLSSGVASPYDIL